MKRTMKRIVSVLLALAMVITSVNFTPKTVSAADLKKLTGTSSTGLEAWVTQETYGGGNVFFERGFQGFVNEGHDVWGNIKETYAIYHEKALAFVYKENGTIKSIEVNGDLVEGEELTNEEGSVTGYAGAASDKVGWGGDCIAINDFYFEKEGTVHVKITGNETYEFDIEVRKHEANTMLNVKWDRDERLENTKDINTVISWDLIDGAAKYEVVHKATNIVLATVENNYWTQWLAPGGNGTYSIIVNVYDENGNKISVTNNELSDLKENPNGKPLSGDDAPASDGGDTINLPLQLIDYRADRMLFEYFGYNNYDFSDRGDLSHRITNTINKYIEQHGEEPVQVQPMWNINENGKVYVPQDDGTYIEQEPSEENAYDFYTKGLLKSSLNKKTGFPEYKDGVVDYLAHQIYEDMNTEGIETNPNMQNAFFQHLRKVMMDYKVKYDTENQPDIPDGAITEPTNILWKDWKIENMDPDYPTAGDWIQPNRTIYSKVFKTLEGENTYTSSCWVKDGVTSDTYKIVVYGYSDIQGNGETVIGEYFTKDEVVNNNQSVEFTIDSEKNPYYRFAIVPIDDSTLSWGNNYTFTVGGEIIIGTYDFKTAFDNGLLSYKKMSGEETLAVPGWQLAGNNLGGTGHKGDAHNEYTVIPGATYYLGIGNAIEQEQPQSGWIDWHSNIEYKIFPIDKDGVTDSEPIVSGTYTQKDLEGNYGPAIKLDVPSDCTKIKIVFTQTEGDASTLGDNWYLSPKSNADNTKVLLGSLEESRAKDNRKEFGIDEDGNENLYTCYDYAYYMLNHLYDPNNIMGKVFNKYKTLKLSPITVNLGNDSERNAYGFFATASEIKPISYDLTTGIISHTDQWSNPDKPETGFFPLSERHTGETLTGDWAETTTEGDNPITENFHYSLKSNGKFVYREADDLFFGFTGDDDVYLFINGKLALDLGSAHYAATDTIYLNELAEQLELEEGNVYDFGFFYMERHTSVANMKIITNINVTDASAVVSKDAYNGNVMIPQGGTISQETDYITYSLTVKNLSEVTKNEDGIIYHPIKFLQLKDSLLGVDLGGAVWDENATNPTTINDDGAYVFNRENYKLGNDGAGRDNKASDLTVHVKYTDRNGVDQDTTIQLGERAKADLMAEGNETLSDDEIEAVAKEYLLGTLEGLGEKNKEIGGYIDGAEITVSGFRYKIKDNPNRTNKILNVATAKFVAKGNDETENLNSAGSATRTVYVGTTNDYFAAVGKEITIPIVEDLDYGKDVELDTVEAKYGKASIDGKTIKYTATDMRHRLDELTVNIKGEEKPVSANVYIFDVGKNYYVLDYGLKADLLHNRDLWGNVTNDRGGMLADDHIDNAYVDTDYIFNGVKTNDTTKENQYNRYDEATGKLQLSQGSISMYKASKITAENGDIITQNDDISEFKKADYKDAKVVYTPKKFMDDVDKFYYDVQVTKAGLDEDDEKNVKNATPVMTGEVNIMPASIVYYEDNFEDLTHKGEADGTNGIVFTGNYKESYSDRELNDGEENNTIPISDRDQYQSIDQSVEYGQDDLYINRVGGMGGSGSGLSYGSAHGMKAGATAAFEFTGTGFDLISRTNSATGIITVMIYKKSEDGKADTRINKDGSIDNTAGKLVSLMTVNTYYVNGDLYQIPVISWKESLAKADKLDKNHKYIVKILTADSKPNSNQTMYIDGLRIYNPLINNQDAIEEGYLESEKGTSLKAIRPLILGEGYKYDNEDSMNSIVGETTYATLVKFDKNENHFLTGKTAVEAYSDKESDLDITKNMMDYLVHGPNNELYLSAGYGFGFKLQNINESLTLQIGVKRISDYDDYYGENASSFDEKPVQIQYLDQYNNWIDFENVSSATEIYYTISTDDLYTVDGTKCVVLRVADDAKGKISFTNLKVKGCELAPLDVKDFDPTTVKNTVAAPENVVIVSGKDKDEKLVVGATAKVTFETSSDVDEISVGTSFNTNTAKFDNIKVVDTTKKIVDGKYYWTIKFKVAEGDTGLGIITYDEEGNYSNVSPIE